MTSGGIKTNIAAEEALTFGEDRTLSFTVRDSTGTSISSFSGWSFAWYLLPTQNTPRTATTVVLTKTSGGGGITSSAPNVDVALDPADTVDLSAKGYFYELWRTDTNNVVRLAYGSVVFID